MDKKKRPSRSFLYIYKLFLPNISDSTNNTKNTKNNSLAISVAAPAIPPKPRIAATTAMTKNITEYLNIVVSSFYLIGLFALYKCFLSRFYY